MDQNSPEGVRDNTRQSLIDTDALIKKWHGAGRLGYAITPLLARKTAQAASLDELLFARIVLGNDRVVEKTMILQVGEALADEIANEQGLRLKIW